MVLYWEFAKSFAELLPHQCVSACVFTLSNVHGAHENTLGKLCQKETKKKINTLVTEEPKTHLVVSQSHSPFFNVSFSIVVVVSRPVTRPSKTFLSDCQLSWKLLRSVFSLLLLLQCIVGSAVRYSKYNSVGPNIARPSVKPTIQPTSDVYCLCERLLGTFACRPA